MCTYFLSHKCVYWVYITHIIKYNISAHLRQTFMASHNKKFWYFWKSGLFKAKIIDFEHPLNFFGMWYVRVPCIYVNYLYLAHSEMISEIKYVHPCGTHTSFSQKNNFWWNFFQLWDPCVPLGCTYFVSLCIFERSRYGSLSVYNICFLCRVEMQK